MNSQSSATRRQRPASNWMAKMQIVRLPELKKMVGLGRSQIYELAGQGRFPKPVKLSQKAVGWVNSEVTDWLAARIAERDAASKL